MVRERIHQPSNYQNGGRDPQDEHAHGLAEAVSDRFKDATEGMQERVGQVADQAIQYAELARDAAFAIGALWMVRRQQPQTAYEAMVARLPSLPDRQSLWPSHWR